MLKKKYKGAQGKAGGRGGNLNEKSYLYQVVHDTDLIHRMPRASSAAGGRRYKSFVSKASSVFHKAGGSARDVQKSARKSQTS